MSNNIFYKALAAVSTAGILVIAGMQVSTALKKGNNADDQLAKTMVEIKDARKEALAEVKELKKQVLNEVKLDKEIKNLIIYKKALFNSEDINENDLLKILNPLIKSDSVWKSHSLYLLAEYYFHNNIEQRVTKYSMAGELVYFYKTSYSKIEIYHGDNPDIEDPDRLIDRKNLSVFSTLDQGTQIYESNQCSLSYDWSKEDILSNMEKLQKELINEIKKGNLL